MIAEFPRDLVVMALPLESQGVFEQAGVPVVYTGLGKVNATYVLTCQLARYRHASQPLPRVLNFGTAGSRSHPTGALVECRAFVQRDMDVTGLGVPLGVTPYEEEVPARIETRGLLGNLPQVVCGSGDSFAIVPSALECDVVDMEAYALAKVCLREGAPFTAIKYVTDGADAGAAADWQKNLHRAAELFLQAYERLRELS